MFEIGRHVLLHGPDKDVILITEGLRIKEIKEVFEGEVTELTPVETEDFVRVYDKDRNTLFVCGTISSESVICCAGEYIW